MFSSRKTSAPANAGILLSKSLRFRSSATAYLSRTFGSPTSTTILTISFWVKRGTLGTQNITFNGGDTTGNNNFYLQFNPSNQINIDQTIGGAQSIRLISTAVFTDPSSWYHIVASIDTTQSTASNRVKLYVNGNQITSFGTATYPAQNAVNQFNVSGRVSNIGKLDYYSLYLDAYIADAYFIDGQALTPSSFGSTNGTTGQWSPAKYTGTYGTNGFHLTFANTTSTTTLGYDTSGNGNNWTATGISLSAGSTYDSMNDVPTLTSATVANYCVLNAANKPTNSTLSNGNLQATGVTTSYALSQSSFALTSGKWYFEVTKNSTSANDDGIALVLPTVSKDISSFPATGCYTLSDDNFAQIRTTTNGGLAVIVSTTNWVNGDIIQCAYDATTGKIWFGRNGSWYPSINGGTVGDPASGTNPTVTGVSGLVPTLINYSTNSILSVNFGQQPYNYTLPTGFVGLNTYNISTGTVTTSGSFTGNASSVGPFVYLNGIPTVMTINGNSVTFGTHANKLSNGFQVITSSSSYNSTGTNTFSVSSTGNVFQIADAQANP